MDENLINEKETLARVRKLQKEEDFTFDEAVKIVNLEIMNKIKLEIYGLTEVYMVNNGMYSP